MALTAQVLPLPGERLQRSNVAILDKGEEGGHMAMAAALTAQVLPLPGERLQRSNVAILDKGEEGGHMVMAAALGAKCHYGGRGNRNHRTEVMRARDGSHRPSPPGGECVALSPAGRSCPRCIWLSGGQMRPDWGTQCPGVTN
jgi:hypothetical protein